MGNPLEVLHPIYVTATRGQRKGNPGGAYEGGIIKPALGTTLNTGHPQAAGLIGAWLFNEGSGTTVADATANGNTGTLSGTTIPAWTTGGPYGTTLTFDGSSSYINLGTPNSLGITAANPVSIMSAGTPTTTGASCVISRGQSGTSFNYQMGLNGGNLCFGNNNTLASLSVAWTANAQAVVIIVSDGTHTNGYVGGSAGTAVAQAATTSSAKNTLIGAESTAGAQNEFYKGTLDFVFVWSRALSAAEIPLLIGNPFTMFSGTIRAGTG